MLTHPPLPRSRDHLLGVLEGRAESSKDVLSPRKPSRTCGSGSVRWKPCWPTAT